MDPENDPGVAQLLDRALPDRPHDPHGLVAGAMTRGRARRRRRQAGTAAAALAVFGVIGAVAAVMPLAGGSGGGDAPTPVATDPTTAPVPSASASPTPAPDPVAITIRARDIPAAVEQVVGRQGASAPLLDPPYGVKDTADEVVVHFRWQGALAGVVIERKPGVDARQQCATEAEATAGTCSTNAAGDVQLTWGPGTADGVSTQGVTVWRGDFEVSTQSANAPDGKNSPTLGPESPLSLDDLSAVAASDAWFD